MIYLHFLILGEILKKKKDKQENKTQNLYQSLGNLEEEL